MANFLKQLAYILADADYEGIKENEYSTMVAARYIRSGNPFMLVSAFHYQLSYDKKLSKHMLLRGRLVELGLPFFTLQGGWEYTYVPVKETPEEEIEEKEKEEEIEELYDEKEEEEDDEFVDDWEYYTELDKDPEKDKEFKRYFKDEPKKERPERIKEKPKKPEDKPKGQDFKGMDTKDDPVKRRTFDEKGNTIEVREDREQLMFILAPKDIQDPITYFKNLSNKFYPKYINKMVIFSDGNLIWMLYTDITRIPKKKDIALDKKDDENKQEFVIKEKGTMDIIGYNRTIRRIDDLEDLISKFRIKEHDFKLHNFMIPFGPVEKLVRERVKEDIDKEEK